jgi:hypothetical protein
MKFFSSKKEEARSPQPFFLEEEDLLGDLTQKKGTSLFLGKFALHEVEKVLRKRGFFKEAKKRGLWPLKFRMDSSAFPPLQRFQIFCKKEDPDLIIVDLKIREGRLHVKEYDTLISPLPESSYLILEWMTLQNPLKQFAPERAPLPGQKYPGLGLGSKVIELFVHLAKVTKNQGILAFPAYFHNAILFSRRFHFLNPYKAGEVDALRTAMPKVPFKDLAWMVHMGCLKDESGNTYEWKSEEQIYPLSQELKKYFDSPAYRNAYKEALKNGKYHVDTYKYLEKKSEYFRNPDGDQSG